MVICLERGADLHTAWLIPLPLTVSCFSKIQIGFTFLVPAHLGSPGKGPLNVCVWVPHNPWKFCNNRARDCLYSESLSKNWENFHFWPSSHFFNLGFWVTNFTAWRSASTVCASLFMSAVHTQCSLGTVWYCQHVVGYWEQLSSVVCHVTHVA